MATFLSGVSVIAEIIDVTIPIPAEGPSLGAPQEHEYENLFYQVGGIIPKSLIVSFAAFTDSCITSPNFPVIAFFH